MSLKDVMNRMLPPQEGKSAHLTSDYGWRKLNGKPDWHEGVDFNYVGGQTGINLTHPPVHSPVDGVVEKVRNRYGVVAIRDAEGNLHEVLHLQSASVERGQRISAGEPIGTMGGRGEVKEEAYAQHVDYRIQNRKGSYVNPHEFWEQDRGQNRSAEGGRSAAPEAAARAAAEPQRAVTGGGTLEPSCPERLPQPATPSRPLDPPADPQRAALAAAPAAPSQAAPAPSAEPSPQPERYRRELEPGVMF